MKFASLRENVRELGLANTALYALARIGGASTAGRVRIFKYYITAQPVPQHDYAPPRRGKSIEVSEADRDVAIQSTDLRPRKVLKARVANGCRCLVARKNGTIVGFQWFTLEDYHEDEVRCLFRLDPNDRCAWDFDIFVFPEWRSQPVFARLWDTCNGILWASGVRYSLSRINAFNAGSRRAHERLGAMIIGWAIFLCLGPLQFTMLSGRPWMHASMRSTTYPILNVSRMAVQSALKRN